MTEAIWVAIIVQSGGVVVAIIAGARKLGAIGRDTKATLAQTENEHQDAEYPNLRDEVTAIRELLVEQSGQTRGLKKSVGGLHADLRLLREEGFEPTICWTNPNIQPHDEWQRRLDELRRWCADGDIELIEAGEDRERWEAGVAPLGADRARRCRACYALRLAEACRVAQERGFEFVGTTLAVSPYQLFETCNDVLERLAAARGLTPVVRDFRPYYPEATRRSRELGMYRQNYCGCRFSAVEAAMDRARIRDERKAAKK